MSDNRFSKGWLQKIGLKRVCSSCSIIHNYEQKNYIIFEIILGCLLVLLDRNVEFRILLGPGCLLCSLIKKGNLVFEIICSHT